MEPWISVKSLFFGNRTIRQTIVKNTFWLALGSGVSRLLKFFLLMYAARMLGATEYGKFTFALAFVSLFVIVHDFGLPRIVVREFAGAQERENEWYSLVSLKILLSVVALGLIAASSFFITPDGSVRGVMVLLAVFSVAGSFITFLFAFFQVRERMEYQAGGLILQDVLIAAIGFFVLARAPSLAHLSFGYLAGTLFSLVVLAVFFHTRVFPLKIAWNTLVWRRFLRMSWPLALPALVYTMYTYIDSVMMGYWGLMTETGWYNAAYRIIEVALIPVYFIGTSFYPALSKLFKESREGMRAIVYEQWNAMIALALPLVAGGVLLAPDVIGFVYGSEFSASVYALRILLVMAGLIFLYAPFYNALIVGNRQRLIFFISLLGAGVNVALNAFLIPRFSLYGAAFATLATNILMFALVAWFVRNLAPLPLFNPRCTRVMLSAMMGTSVMSMLITLGPVSVLPVVWKAAIGAASYAFAMFCAMRFFLFHADERA